jgi:hypothetical protein
MEFNGLMNNLHSYTFTNNNSKKLLLLFEKKIEEKHSTSKSVSLESKQSTSLFWCYYIFKKGIAQYEILGEDNFKYGNEEKIRLIEQIRANKDFIKKNKWKIRQMEEDLLYNKDISISTFFCICLLNNINIVFIRNVIYYRSPLTGPVHCIQKNGNKYTIEEYNEAHLKGLWRVDNIEKPLKAIGNYKADELRQIGNLLALDIHKSENKFKKKSDIYKMILDKIE